MRAVLFFSLLMRLFFSDILLQTQKGLLLAEASQPHPDRARKAPVVSFRHRSSLPVQAPDGPCPVPCAPAPGVEAALRSRRAQPVSGMLDGVPPPDGTWRSHIGPRPCASGRARR